MALAAPPAPLYTSSPLKALSVRFTMSYASINKIIIKKTIIIIIIIIIINDKPFGLLKVETQI